MKLAGLLVAGLCVAFLVPGASPADVAARPGALGVIEALDAGASLAPGALVASTLRAVAEAEGIAVASAGACPTLSEAVARHAERLGVAAPLLPLGIPAKLDQALGCLLGAVHDANAARDATFSGVPTRDLLAYWENEVGSAALDALLEGRSHAEILVAAIQAAERVDVATQLLRELPTLHTALPPIDLRPILRFEPVGSQVYEHNYALIVDLEGDDVYDNNAAGVFVAIGAGLYDVGPGSEWQHVGAFGTDVGVGGKTQDADAVVSSGLVLDVSGNDAYGKKYPVMLKDKSFRCGGEDVVPWVGTIGGGIIGAGLLFDLGGDNTFTGRTQTQGGGHLLGVGVLYTGEGPDAFEAARAGQGSGLLGGVGLLIDRGGDSTYTSRVPPLGIWNGDLSICDVESRYTQGSSFDRRAGPLLHGVGILADLGGNDRYVTVDGFLAQGFGQGIGLGLLYEKDGDDSYSALMRSQGAAQGRSKELNPQAPWGGGQAVLWEEAGDDAYTIGTEGQGWALGHPADNPPNPMDPVGALQWGLDRNEAVGLLADHAGADTYAGAAGRADGVIVVDGVLGVFADRA